MFLKMPFNTKLLSICIFLSASLIIKSCNGEISNHNPIQNLQIKLQEIQLTIGEIKSDLTYKTGDLKYQDTQLQKVNSDFESLNFAALAMADNIINSIKEKANTLKDNTSNARKSIMDTKKQAQIIESLQKIENAITDLIGLIDDKIHENDEPPPRPITEDIDKKLEEFNKKLQQKEEEDKIKNLPYECIEAIKSLDYDKAEKILNSITDEKKYYFIIDEVYNNQAKNFEKILKFGDHVRSVGKAYVIYRSLYKQLTANDHLDPIKILKLLQSVQTEVIKQKNIPEEIIDQAKNFKEEMEANLRTLSKTALVESVVSETYKKQDIKDIYKGIYYANIHLFNILLNDTFVDLYHKVPHDRILDFIESFGEEYIQIDGIHRLYELFEADNVLQSTAIVRLGFMIRDIMRSEEYDGFSDEDKVFCKSVRDNLPLSVRNAAFSSKVCIRNVNLEEYLYAAGDDWNVDAERRTVFTWIPKTKVKNGYWKIDRDGGEFNILNTFFEEYLFAGHQSFLLGDRKVLTWRKGGKITQGKFIIEPSGNNCYFKNIAHGEYLRADVVNHDKDRRRVVTASSADNRTLWEIEDCHL